MGSLDAVGSSIVAVLMAVIGVAVIAVLVSRNAATGSVLLSGGQAFSQILGAAISPVTGQSISTSIPGLSLS